MKIVQLYDSYIEKGGVERVLALLLNAWSEQGHDVALLVRQGKVSDPYPLVERIKTASLGRATKGGRPTRMMNYARDVFALRNHSFVTQADVVIANGPWCGLIAILALKLPGLRRRKPALIVCDHNSPSAFGRMSRIAYRLLYRYADSVLSLTQAQSRYYQSFARKVCIIPNPVRSEAQDSFDVTTANTAHTVLAVGRLTHQKGFDHLLSAWAQVLVAVPDARLTIVGEGPDHEVLVQQARTLDITHAVTFAPFTSDIASYYRSTSMLVMSSRHEGLALVLLEAQSHGLPIVSFDCEFGPREVIEDEVSGLLCEPENPTALAQGLVRLLQDDALRERQSLAARAAADRYALPTVLNKWDALLHEVQQSGR